MQDAVLKGTGNSRFLKSVTNFLALYPTYEAFADALANGTLTIDFSGINEEGWAQLGTPLDKANLLTDSTAALADLGDEATPNDMFAALYNLMASVKKTADSAATTASSASSTASSALTKANNLITYGTSDLTAGSSNLTTGRVYLVYK